MEQEIPPKRKRDWFFILTPCLFITILLTTIIVLPLLRPGGAIEAIWMRILFLPALLLALFGDIGSRVFLYQHEDRGRIIWIVQTIMMMAGFILWKVFIR
ncbi:hypothetical protein [Chitinophaga pinensis]|uniref:hypothetical protein n=1 Tax=Chitinophaga pinensis TaxID=79329 RepID=UPI00019E3F71|nr:hypothetical protein [Chitinophaga pinensis]